ncbi:flagellar export chaperone FliS [Desulfovibrio fairfieldensis]|uniref:Flagellar export chaperone FliS n=1 Tax=Desulfovibrio fairfieldensis TaxID=44742 RepID=A0A0X8JL28_9BACT|nr:flagellar export chaperone FliS [Desulfovibrio fairfieldensis]AMD90727.1 flagellar export chaperone FliS [Desulfovibrio fairfieldensis]
MNKAAQAYFQTKVSTTDQGQLLIMLYDGALNYLQQARDKMLARDFAGKGILISKVIDIVNELSASLNMDKGGSLAVNLNNLYILCTARLLQANLKMNVESLDSVVHILSGLRGAYAQIIETPEARRAAAEIAGRMQPAGSAMKTAQPIMQAPVTAVPRAHARAAYGRNAMQPGIPAAAPTAPSAPAEAAARAHVQNFAPPAAPVAPVAARLPGAYAKPDNS